MDPGIDIMSPMTATPPKGPSVHETARTAEIRAVAAQLFQSAGYSATTMNDIATATGVLPGSLYHHFASKEEIAVELMEAFNQDLAALASEAGRRQHTPVGSAEDEVRRLAADATALSLRHGAAVRLRAFEAPTVSTERLRTAMQFSSPALGKVWMHAITALAAEKGVDIAHPGLLRFAFLSATLGASMAHPADDDSGKVSAQICDLLLHGLAVDCPDPGTLDASPAAQTARDTISSWKNIRAGADSDGRAAIVEAARTEFARRGYSATTIRDIADAAGVRMGTLYRRIDSKEAILREILEEYSSLLDHAVRSVLTADSTPIESLDGIARVFIHASRRFRKESEIVKLGWSGRESGSNPFRDYYLQTQERLALWENMFRTGQADGSLRTFAPPTELAIHVRTVLWIPFQDYSRTSESRAHEFIRATVLKGALNP